MSIHLESIWIFRWKKEGGYRKTRAGICTWFTSESYANVTFTPESIARWRIIIPSGASSLCLTLAQTGRPLSALPWPGRMLRNRGQRRLPQSTSALALLSGGPRCEENYFHSSGCYVCVLRNGTRWRYAVEWEILPAETSRRPWHQKKSLSAKHQRESEVLAQKKTAIISY